MKKTKQNKTWSLREMARESREFGRMCVGCGSAMASLGLRFFTVNEGALSKTLKLSS